MTHTNTGARTIALLEGATLWRRYLNARGGVEQFHTSNDWRNWAYAQAGDGDVYDRPDVKAAQWLSEKAHGAALWGPPEEFSNRMAPAA